MKKQMRDFSAGVCVAAAFCCVGASGQTITANVGGTVTDSTGSVIAGATVTATNVDTNVAVTTTSNQDGIYTIRFLQIGRYKISITDNGFSSSTTAPFSLEVGQDAKVDAKLTVGKVNDTVVVTSASPILNTEDPSTGASITAAQATELPLQARNFSSLTTLVAGSVATSPSNANNVGRPTYNSGFFINGNREQTNNYTLDGVDINDAIDNYINYSPNVDALAELHIISGNATAEYGNANGGQVVMVTKSGTNNFHGNAFWFLENNNLNANSWTNKHTDDPTSIGPVPSLNRSIFGGTFGGPVIRDRLFFFVDYQGARQHSSSTEFDSVATAAMRAGFAPTLKQNVTVSNPVALYLFAHPELYPLPNVATTSLTNNYFGTQANSTVNNQGDVKVDGKLTSRDNLFGRFTIGRERDGDSKVSIPTRLGGANISPYTGFSINWTHVVSSRIVNEARAGFSRGRFSNLVYDPAGKLGLGANNAAGIRGNQIAPGLTAFNIQNSVLGSPSNSGTAFGTQGVQNDSLTNAFTYGDNLSWQLGRHNLKFGGTAIRYQSNRNYSGNDGVLGHFDYDGTYTALQHNGVGDAWADFLQNQASAFGQGSYVSKWGQRQWRDALFFQDDWKVTPDLTLNLGLRWEWDQPLYESHNKESNLNIFTGAITIAGQNGASRALYNAFWNGWMPRVGFAYSPSSLNNKFVVRGGYGITNFLEGTGANLRLTLNPPFFSNAAGSQSGTSPYFQTQAGFPLPTASATFAGNVRAWEPNLRPALVQQFNLTTETQVDANTSLGIAYLGQTGNHLVDPREGNQAHFLNGPLPVSSLPGLGLVSQVSYTESEAVMNYNSLQVTGRRRFNHGFEFLTNYTWSKGLSNNLGYYGGTGSSQSAYWQDAYNGAADYGPTFFDATHIFTFAGYYDLPVGRGKPFGANMNRVVDALVGGWKVGTVANLHSGFPFTVSSPGNYKVNQRANRANQYRKLVVRNRSVDHWFGTDPSADGCGVDTDNGTCAYGQESSTAFGTASVGSERSPGFKNVDANLSKSFTLIGERNLEFRSSFYNVLNTTSLAAPQNSVSAGNFGQITGTLSTERQIELALKLNF